MYISNSFKLDGFEVSDLKFSVSNLSTCYLDFGGSSGRVHATFKPVNQERFVGTHGQMGAFSIWG